MGRRLQTNILAFFQKREVKMPILFFDTETTGFIQDRVPFNDPSQPHLLQLAAWLDDDNGNLRGLINLIVTVNGTEVPYEAYKVHGISREIANSLGVSLISAIALFNNLAARADVLIGHNVSFDLNIMNVAYARLNKLDSFASNIKTKQTFCTKEATTAICKIPNRNGRPGYKWPTLDEAYRTLVNANGFSNAHDAMADVKACREIFYALKHKGTEND